MSNSNPSIKCDTKSTALACPKNFDPKYRVTTCCESISPNLICKSICFLISLKTHQREQQMVLCSSLPVGFLSSLPNQTHRYMPFSFLPAQTLSANIAWNIWFTFPLELYEACLITVCKVHMGLIARKTVFGGLRTTQAQTSLSITSVWSAPLFLAFWKVPYVNLLRVSLGDWFEYCFDRNPEDRFSSDEAHIISALSTSFLDTNFETLEWLWVGVLSDCHF